MTSLINQVLSSSTAFYISSHQLFFSERKLSESESLRSVLPKRERNDTQGEPLSVELLEDASGDCGCPPSAPLISCETSSHREMVEMSVPVDVVGVFPFDNSLSTVAGALKSAIAAQLRATREAIYWKVKKGGREGGLTFSPKLTSTSKLPSFLLALYQALFPLTPPPELSCCNE